jgi:hypothetical protein
MISINIIKQRSHKLKMAYINIIEITKKDIEIDILRLIEPLMTSILIYEDRF